MSRRARTTCPRQFRTLDRERCTWLHSNVEDVQQSVRDECWHLADGPTNARLGVHLPRNHLRKLVCGPGCLGIGHAVLPTKATTWGSCRGADAEAALRRTIAHHAASADEQSPRPRGMIAGVT